jgi:glycosyltransferase involved in cell wall biosynthesis
MTKVSVLINNFNYGKYLSYCIDSILNQTYKNIEIIVYDDGSNDNSLDVLNSYGSSIQVIANPNHNKSPAFNQGNAIYQAVKRARGKIICLLDSDDAFLPHKVEEVVKAFELDERICMVQNRMYDIDSFNNPLGFITKNIVYNLDVLRAVYKLQHLGMFFVPTSGLSFTKAYLEKVLPFDEVSYPLIWPDVRLSRSALFYGKILTLDKPAGEYRRHIDNDSKKLKDGNYWKEFTSQHHNFFNQLAIANNLPTINPKKNLAQYIYFIFNFLGLKMPIKVKLVFLLRKVNFKSKTY